VSDAVVVALVGLASTIVSILLTARVNTKVNRVGRDAAAARIQVENNHETNMREEGDDRHAENSSKLDTIIRDLSRLRTAWGGSGSVPTTTPIRYTTSN